MKYIFLLSLISAGIFTQAQVAGNDTMQIISDNDSVRINMNGKETAFANTDMAAYYLQMGVESASKGEYETAEGQLRTALLYDLENPEIIYNLGLTEYYMENYEKAIEYFDAAAEFDVENANIYDQRGLAKAMMGEYENAETDFKIMLKYDADFPMGNYNYGILLLQTGETEKACILLNRADKLGYTGAANVIDEYCK